MELTEEGRRQVLLAAGEMEPDADVLAEIAEIATHLAAWSTDEGDNAPAYAAALLDMAHAPGLATALATELAMDLIDEDCLPRERVSMEHEVLQAAQGRSIRRVKINLPQARQGVAAAILIHQMRALPEADIPSNPKTARRDLGEWA